MLTPNTYLHCSIMVAKRLQVLGRKKREQKEQADKGGWGGLGQCPNFLQVWSGEGLDSVPISYKSGLPS